MTLKWNLLTKMKLYLKYKTEKKEIADVFSTIKTVEKIAASYVRIMKNKVIYSQNYVADLNKMFSNFVRIEGKFKHPLFESRPDSKTLLVVVLGDKGLTGGLYNKLLKKIETEKYSESILVGKKSEEKAKEGLIKNPVATYPFPYQEVAKVEQISKDILSRFYKKEVSSVKIAYNFFESLAIQTPLVKTFIPLTFPESIESKSSDAFPIYEPDKMKVFSHLIMEYLKVDFYQAIMSAELSEFAARTVSLESASQKAQGLIKKKNYQYLRARNKSITQEQMESFVGHKI